MAYTIPSTKDPSDVLDYKFDFKALTHGADGARSDWLESNESISLHVITADAGITVDSSSITDSNTSVTVWLSGGTADTNYTIACKIVTSASRTVEKSIIVRVRSN